MAAAYCPNQCTIVTDKQVDHSLFLYFNKNIKQKKISFFPFFSFFYLFSTFFFPPFHEAVAGITERSMVSLNDPTGIRPTISPINHNRSFGGPSL